MRLGGPTFGDCSTPAKWTHALQTSGYRAAYCPVDKNAPDDLIAAFADAASEADIIIAEVGAWSNPLSPDESVRRAALEHCKAQLTLADKIGARCCVNISGSRGEQWDGPHQDNLTPETFDMVVASVQEIIDAVKPDRSFYTLETMPWMYPDSPQSYLDLVQAIDRPNFAVHLDPVNLICSPQRYFSNAAFIQKCFRLLGPNIKSCHAKDIKLADNLTVHLDEVRPGLGLLDYRVFLEELDKLDADTPLMLEHLSSEADYSLARGYVNYVSIGVLR